MVELGLRTLAKQFNMGRKAVIPYLEEAYSMNRSIAATRAGARTAIENATRPIATTATHEGYSAFGAHTLAVDNPRVVKNTQYPIMNKKQQLSGFNPEVLPPRPGAIPPTKVQSGATDLTGEIIPGAPSRAPSFIANPESFNPAHAGVSMPKPDKYTGLFSENSGSKFTRPFATAMNGFLKGDSASGAWGLLNMSGKSALRWATPGLIGGAAGGMTNAIGSMVMPNNVEYQGMVSPIIKGAIAGVAIGAGRGALSRLGTKYGAHHETLARMPGMVNNRAAKMLTAGAIGASSWASTGETHLTRPISG